MNIESSIDILNCYTYETSKRKCKPKVPQANTTSPAEESDSPICIDIAPSSHVIALTPSQSRQSCQPSPILCPDPVIPSQLRLTLPDPDLDTVIPSQLQLTVPDPDADPVIPSQLRLTP